MKRLHCSRRNRVVSNVTAKTQIPGLSYVLMILLKGAGYFQYNSYNMISAYKQIGKERMIIRKQKRNQKYKERSAINKQWGRTMRNGENYWVDNDSPTGYSQICDYIGTCQYPCNGDC